MVTPVEIFGFSDYREYMTHRISSDEEGRGYQKKLAVAAGCQSSYLSQVLSGQANLTVEQAVGLCVWWQFDEDETDFFLALVQIDRAGTPKLREHLQQKIDQLRTRRRKLSNRFRDAGEITPGQETEYYSTWYLPIIHTMVSVPRFRKPAAIAAALSMPQSAVESALANLEKAGLVQQKDGLWSNTARSIHLKSDSPLNYVYHGNIRQLAGRSMQRTEPGQSIHYSAVYSLSEKDFDRLKQQFITAIEESRSVVRDSKEEAVVVFGLDFFRI
ncbi:MAG: hypothetical protein RIQ81_473 [Pseudomonadota bacterium]